jgi:hypothetical protein
MSTVTRVLLIGGVAAALLLAALLGLWLFLAPVELAGTREIRHLGCDDLSSVSARADSGPDPSIDYATSIDCRVPDSQTAPSCAAVWGAYHAAPGHREGNAMVEVNRATTVGGKPTFRVTCRQILAPDGSVVYPRD